MFLFNVAGTRIKNNQGKEILQLPTYPSAYLPGYPPLGIAFQPGCITWLNPPQVVHFLSIILLEDLLPFKSLPHLMLPGNFFRFIFLI